MRRKKYSSLCLLMSSVTIVVGADAVNAAVQVAEKPIILAMGEKQVAPQPPEKASVPVTTEAQPNPDVKDSDSESAAEEAPKYDIHYDMDIDVTPEMMEKYLKAQKTHDEEDDHMLGDHLHGEELRNAVPPTEMLKIRAAAESGDAYAQGELGEFYHMGMGVERDLRKAFFWFREGAENGDTNSMRYLGKYYMGEFPELKIDKNLDEAQKWLVKLVRIEDPMGMAMYGRLLYQRAREGEKHYEPEAAYWYDRGMGGNWDPDYEPPSLKVDASAVGDEVMKTGEVDDDVTETENEPLEQAPKNK
ncbi:MAG: sel1 repeat family protein [Alphaproteobacteria bacterium]|nr:sel1 repeat family protein [Alphaproteobacteria bacterium]